MPRVCGAGGGHSARDFRQGKWRGVEKEWHINTKELVAGKRCVEAMMETGDYIHLGMDSKTAVAFCNRQGGTRSKILNSVASQLWDHVLRMGGWLRATWLPRDCNQISDMLSKENLLTWEFGLKAEATNRLWNRWGIPLIDCFASRTFHVIPTYYSFFPDDRAAARDAFSVTRWPGWVYAFPPVPLIPMTLEKIRTDGSTAILVVPLWNTAKWWDRLTELLVEPPITLGDHRAVLQPMEGRRLPRLGVIAACLVRSPHTRC